MKINRITTEQALYALALLLAVAVRLLNLGATSLSDAEAVWALQALKVAQGEQVALGPQPGYIFLTGLAFWLFGSSDAIARFWPALLGGSLALLPVFFRRLIGREAALILAFGLALDPGLVALSRLAGGPMMAVGFTLLALAMLAVRRPVLAGLLAAMALLSGPAALNGLLGIGLAWAVGKLLGLAPVLPALASPGEDGAAARVNYRRGAISFVVALLVVGTLFFRFPQGLGAWVATLPAYLAGWVNSSGVPALRLLAGLVIYQPFALVFGLIGIVRVWMRSTVRRLDDLEDRADLRDRVGRFLSLWLLFALALALLYPSREMGHLAWSLVPLWALAAMALADLLFEPVESPFASLGHAALVFLLLALFWLNLSGMGNTEPGVQAYLLHLGLLLGVIALAGLTTVLVGLGWSWGAALRGLVWGFSAALFLYMSASMWRVSQYHPSIRPSVQELWSAAPAAGQQDLLLDTLAELSRWHTGRPNEIDVTVEVESPSLRWALRHFPQARFVSESQRLQEGTGWVPDVSPAVLITRQSQQSPNLPASYRGQDFVWWETPAWEGVLPPDFPRWLVFRQAPLQQEQVILWARNDLFPGSSLASGEEAPASEEGQPAELQPVE